MSANDGRYLRHDGASARMDTVSAGCGARFAFPRFRACIPWRGKKLSLTAEMAHAARFIQMGGLGPGRGDMAWVLKLELVHGGLSRFVQRFEGCAPGVTSVNEAG